MLALGAGFACAPAPVAERAAETVFPGASWERIADPAAAGFSAEALDAIHPYVDGINTSAVMAVVGGRVLFEHGPVDSLSYLASVRKSILAMLYGNYVEDGTIDLGLTLEDLGMDDVQGLLPIEKRARPRPRHGPVGGLSPGFERRGQPRGRPAARFAEPGTYYLYSNWDFNASGAVFEQLTAATSTTRSKPTSPCRWGSRTGTARSTASRGTRRARGTSPTTWSLHARHGPDRIRDAAGRNVEGERILPDGWAERIVGIVTPSEEMNPEGCAGRVRLRVHVVGVGRPRRARGFEGAYSGRGAYGQFITVIPSVGMVVAHKTVPDAQTPWSDYMGILTRLVAAHCGADC